MCCARTAPVASSSQSSRCATLRTNWSVQSRASYGVLETRSFFHAPGAGLRCPHADWRKRSPGQAHVYATAGQAYYEELGKNSYIS